MLESCLHTNTHTDKQAHKAHRGFKMNNSIAFFLKAKSISDAIVE